MNRSGKKLVENYRMETYQLGLVVKPISQTRPELDTVDDAFSNTRLRAYNEVYKEMVGSSSDTDSDDDSIESKTIQQNSTIKRMEKTMAH